MPSGGQSAPAQAPDLLPIDGLSAAFGTHVPAPMPALSWDQLSNNSLAAPPTPSRAEPINEHQAPALVITPQERDLLMGVERRAFYTQLSGFALGALAGAYYAKARKPLPGWRGYTLSVALGMTLSPLLSIPLSIQFSRPYLQEIKQDPHLTSVIQQSERTHIPLDMLPVSEHAVDEAAPSATAPPGFADSSSASSAAPSP